MYTHTHCVRCSQLFSDANVKTEAGWKEIKISGFCELCWDKLFAEPEDENCDAELYHPDSED